MSITNINNPKIPLYIFKINNDNFENIQDKISITEYGYIKKFNKDSDKLLLSTGFTNIKNASVFTNAKFKSADKNEMGKIKIQYDSNNVIHKKITLLSDYFLNLKNKVDTNKKNYVANAENINFKFVLDMAGQFKKLYVFKGGKKINIENVSSYILKRVINNSDCDILFSLKRLDGESSNITALISSITVKYSNNLDFLKEFTPNVKPLDSIQIKESLGTNDDSVKYRITKQDIKNSNKIITDALNIKK